MARRVLAESTFRRHQSDAELYKVLDLMGTDGKGERFKLTHHKTNAEARLINHAHAKRVKSAYPRMEVYEWDGDTYIRWPGNLPE
jgi:hypothetical protein